MKKVKSIPTRTYTLVGKEKGYTQVSIDKAIKQVEWEQFRIFDLPFSQGSCLNSVIKECTIPISKISRMSLHGLIDSGTHEHHGFYALDVKYKDGQAQIYIADNGCSACVVASDFLKNEES